MAEWQYSEPGKTYNQVGLQYNFLSGVVAAAKNYYTGSLSAAKRMLRGMGF